MTLAADDPAVYRRIARSFEQQIRAGTLPPGSPIPSERALASEYGISRMTARRAIDVLAQRGLVERRGRAGTFVARPKLIWDFTSVAGLHEQLSRQGVVPSSDVLRAETVPAGELDPDVGRMLELEPDQPVHVVCRRRLGDGEPLALEESYFPARRFPDLLQQDLGASIYGILATCYSVHPVRAHQEIEPTLLPASAAAALGTGPDIPVLRVTRTAWDAFGQPIEFARDIYRGDRLRFVAETGAPTSGSNEAMTRLTHRIHERGPTG
ncbi:MAG TPA: GntR family transcriptional regulator [Thermomicrobiales bacterium]